MSYHRYELPRNTTPFDEIASVVCLSVVMVFLLMVVIILWCVA